MKCQTAHHFVAIAVLLAIASPATSGVFDGSEDLMSNLIVHPPKFEGDGGQLTVTVCIQPGGEVIRPSVDDAIELWNGLVPTVGNCPGCITSETFVGLPPGQVPPIFSLLRTATHELGHCGLGLGHTNWDVTSSSSAKDATAIRRCNTTPPCPPESIAGDTDDFALPNPPAIPAARIIHWFKDDPARPENTNNPFVIDDTLIDESTFTRRRIDLPSGHTWPANANADSAEVFGFTNTQATMYSSVFGGEAFRSLTADDVATVQFAQTGFDKMAGTADDYSALFSFVPDCADADIEIAYVPGSMDPQLNDGVTGICNFIIQPVPGAPSPVQHFRVEPLGGAITIKINSEIPWREFEPIFTDGFESGDTSGWSMTIP